MHTLNNKIKIDESKNIVENEANNDAQTASQPTGNGQAEKESRWTRKRIGLFAVIAITAIATVLTTTTANPLVLGAIKKEAIPFGTWLVSAIGEGLVGQALSDYWAKATDQVAYATVHGAQYVTNEYKQKSESKSGSKWVTDWETSADMGKEDDLGSCIGWNGPEKRSMTQAEVQNLLRGVRAKGKIITVAGNIEYTVPLGQGANRFFAASFSAREDQLESQKAITLAWYRALFDIIDWIDLFDPAKLVWRDEVSRTTTTYNLGSIEMVSEFEDANPILPELGTGPEEVIDGDANYHSVKVNWYKYPLLPNGTWGDPEKTHKYCEFNAWETDTRGFDLCNENEKISDPQFTKELPGTLHGGEFINTKKESLIRRSLGLSGPRLGETSERSLL